MVYGSMVSNLFSLRVEHIVFKINTLGHILCPVLLSLCQSGSTKRVETTCKYPAGDSCSIEESQQEWRPHSWLLCLTFQSPWSSFPSLNYSGWGKWEPSLTTVSCSLRQSQLCSYLVLPQAPTAHQGVRHWRTQSYFPLLLCQVVGIKWQSCWTVTQSWSGHTSEWGQTQGWI